MLGVSKDADAKQLKRAYRKRAIKTHPDKGELVKQRTLCIHSEQGLDYVSWTHFVVPGHLQEEMLRNSKRSLPPSRSSPLSTLYNTNDEESNLHSKSLSLSLTHTCTHIHTHTRMRAQ